MNTLTARPDLIERLQALATQEQRPLDDVLEALLDHYAGESEAAWEARVLAETLGDALLPDDELDFDRLIARGTAMSPHDLYPQGRADDE